MSFIFNCLPWRCFRRDQPEEAKLELRHRPRPSAAARVPAAGADSSLRHRSESVAPQTRRSSGNPLAAVKSTIRTFFRQLCCGFCRRPKQDAPETAAAAPDSTVSEAEPPRTSVTLESPGTPTVADDASSSSSPSESVPSSELPSPLSCPSPSEADSASESSGASADQPSPSPMSSEPSGGLPAPGTLGEPDLSQPETIASGVRDVPQERLQVLQESTPSVVQDGLQAAQPPDQRVAQPEEESERPPFGSGDAASPPAADDLGAQWRRTRDEIDEQIAAMVPTSEELPEVEALPGPEQLADVVPAITPAAAAPDPLPDAPPDTLSDVSIDVPSAPSVPSIAPVPRTVKTVKEIMAALDPASLIFQMATNSAAAKQRVIAALRNVSVSGRVPPSEFLYRRLLGMLDGKERQTIKFLKTCNASLEHVQAEGELDVSDGKMRHLKTLASIGVGTDALELTGQIAKPDEASDAVDSLFDFALTGRQWPPLNRVTLGPKAGTTPAGLRAVCQLAQWGARVDRPSLDIELTEEWAVALHNLITLRDSGDQRLDLQRVRVSTTFADAAQNLELLRAARKHGAQVTVKGPVDLVRARLEELRTMVLSNFAMKVEYACSLADQSELGQLEAALLEAANTGAKGLDIKKMQQVVTQRSAKIRKS